MAISFDSGTKSSNRAIVHSTNFPLEIPQEKRLTRVLEEAFPDEWTHYMKQADLTCSGWCAKPLRSPFRPTPFLPHLPGMLNATRPRMNPTPEMPLAEGCCPTIPGNQPEFRTGPCVGSKAWHSGFWTTLKGYPSSKTPPGVSWGLCVTTISAQTVPLIPRAVPMITPQNFPHAILHESISQKN